MRFGVLALLMLVQAPQRSHAIGIGNSACSDWTKDHSSKRVEDFVVDDTWVFGYLSAAEDAAGQAPILLSVDGLVARVSAYCADHPTATIHDASRSVASALTKK